MTDLGYPMTLANAANWARGRGGTAIAWIVVHCTDAAYADDYPTSLGGYWAREKTQVSTHYGISDTQVVQYVAHADTAYSAREPGNSRGVHIEFAGLSAWTRADWLEHDDMLRRGAQLIVQIAAKHGIPVGVRRLTAAELRATKAGITCHVDLTTTFTGTHLDPGPGFPWDRLFQHIVDIQEDDMFTDADRATLQGVGWALGTNKGQVPEQVRDAQEATAIAALDAKVTALSAKVDTLIAALKPVAVNIDVKRQANG